MSKTVTVLMGGWSSEREVSLSSGENVARALAEQGYVVHLHDIRRDLEGLGEAVRADVLAKTGVQLDWEIKRIGRPASP